MGQKWFSAYSDSCSNDLTEKLMAKSSKVTAVWAPTSPLPPSPKQTNKQTNKHTVHYPEARLQTYYAQRKSYIGTGKLSQALRAVGEHMQVTGQRWLLAFSPLIQSAKTPENSGSRSWRVAVGNVMRTTLVSSFWRGKWRIEVKKHESSDLE